jgi:hypothetical protein
MPTKSSHFQSLTPVMPISLVSTTVALPNFSSLPINDMPDNDFPFVTLCDLTKEREDEARVKQFCRPYELTQHLQGLRSSSRSNIIAEQNDAESIMTNATPNRSRTHLQCKPRLKHPGLIVFLRGSPSPMWLNHLGAALDIDPELFFRHLDVASGYVSSVSQLGASYRTPLPKSKDLIRLRVCNTGSWNISNSQTTLAQLREGCEASMSQQLDDFMHSRNISIGNSTVRQFVLHDLQNFSIQQQISIEVIYHTNTWSGKSA